MIRELAAHHESGHAILAYICRRKIRSITIAGEGKGMVRCQGLNRDARDKFSPREWCALVREEIYICLAGPIAEQRLSGTDDPEAWEVDIEMAERWMKDLEPDVSARELAAVTLTLLEDERAWAAVSEVAACLIETGSMSGPNVEAICRWIKVPRAIVAA